MIDSIHSIGRLQNEDSVVGVVRKFLTPVRKLFTSCEQIAHRREQFAHKKFSVSNLLTKKFSVSNLLTLPCAEKCLRTFWLAF